MTVNISKARESRFWKIWQDSGAVGNIENTMSRSKKNAPIEVHQPSKVYRAPVDTARYDSIRPISMFWDLEVRPLVDKCAVGYGQLMAAERAGPGGEQDEIINEMKTEHGERDWTSVFYIGQMAGKVEHELADGRDPRVAIITAHGVLNSDDFYNNVFDGEETEETRNYRALGEKLTEMMALQKAS